MHHQSGAPKPRAPQTHWSVCQVNPTRAHLIRSEIERGGRGTFCPTYAKVSYPDGKRSSSERQLLPGYLFVRTEGGGDFYDDYGAKIARTLGWVADGDVARLMVEHATGRWNEVAAPVKVAAPVTERRRVRRRRPRAGKRYRGARALAAAG